MLRHDHAPGWGPGGSEVPPAQGGRLLSRRVFVAGVLGIGSSLLLPARQSRAVDVLAGVRPREAWAKGLPPRGPLPVEAPGDVRFLLLHHSATSNRYAADDVPAILRSFYHHHTGSKGWPDVAYNFLVDRHGTIWEGRQGSIERPVKGDATGGSQGFALLGCFVGDHSSEPPTPEAVEAMAALFAALGHRYRIDTTPGARTSFTSRGSNLHPAGSLVTTPTVAGHRTMSNTTCPGDAAYALLEAVLPARVAQIGASMYGAGGTAAGVTQPRKRIERREPPIWPDRIADRLPARRHRRAG